MITWELSKKLFDAFSILRWTDFIRPIEFVQMDKNASQAVLSYIIGKEYEENSKIKLNWDYVVESNIYGLLCKIATSDIKSTVSNKIKKEHLNDFKNYILSFYFDDNKHCRYKPEGIINYNNLNRYLNESNKGGSTIEFQICYAAHKLATYREFLHIQDFNKLCPDITTVYNEINPASICTKIKDPVLQSIVQEISNDHSPLCNFFSYFEKLRPQIRWSQTCRMPQTTVLGHSMYVAVLTFFAIKELQIQNNQTDFLVNSFFAALFHDLPESLTRDIISPVKRNINNLDEQLSKYEFQEVNDRMISLIPNKNWKFDFLNLLGATDTNNFDTFKDRPYILGSLIKNMDILAAFVEAKMSVAFGIDTDELQKGIKYCSSKLENIEINYNTFEWLNCRNTIRLNDFLASIPHFTEGVQ